MDNGIKLTPIGLYNADISESKEVASSGTYSQSSQQAQANIVGISVTSVETSPVLMDIRAESLASRVVPQFASSSEAAIFVENADMSNRSIVEVFPTGFLNQYTEEVSALPPSLSSVISEYEPSTSRIRIEPSILHTIPIPIEIFSITADGIHSEIGERAPLMFFQQSDGSIILEHDNMMYAADRTTAQRNYSPVVESFITTLGNNARHFSSEQRTQAREEGLSRHIIIQVFNDIAAANSIFQSRALLIDETTELTTEQSYSDQLNKDVPAATLPRDRWDIDLHAANPLQRMLGIFDIALNTSLTQSQQVGNDSEIVSLYQIGGISLDMARGLVQAISWADSYSDIRAFATEALAVALSISLDDPSRATRIAYNTVDLVRRIIVFTVKQHLFCKIEKSGIKS